ncbi:recombinase family protein [Bacillus sp. JJ1562]|uniref:recombinase family protein n=1 Tax=Bacillus sp. JJ1562 TaxID=3122960 RepID=UPI003001C7EA
MTNKTDPALATVRTSDIRQKDNLSFETQKQEIILRAKQEGYHIVEFIEEPSQSAYKKRTLQRKVMQKLLSKALDNSLNIKAIFFYDESRVSRQFEDFKLEIYNTIIDAKPYFKFFSTSSPGEWNPSDITSIINFVNASQESVKKSQRAKSAQITKLNREERPGADAPFGYNLDGTGNLVVVNEQARIVILIFFLTSWGHSQNKILKLLNEYGILSPRGKKWTGKTIEYILNNDSYLGHLPWNINESRNSSRKKQRGEYDLILNNHEPIVNPLLWHLAHQTIEIHKKNGGNNDTPFVFRNLLYCSNCQKQLHTKDYSTKLKEYRYYICKGCNCKVTVQEVHEELFKHLGQSISMKASSIKEQVQKTFKKREELILKHLQDLKAKLTNSNFNLEQIQESPDLVKSSEWDFIISTAISRLKRDIHNTNRFAELVKLLIEDQSLEVTFSKLARINQSNLCDAELRTLALVYFKEVKIDFKEKTYKFIKYTLTPFAGLEEYLDQIG